jgi:hypothetical protein
MIYVNITKLRKCYGIANRKDLIIACVMTHRHSCRSQTIKKKIVSKQTLSYILQQAISWSSKAESNLLCHIHVH